MSTSHAFGMKDEVDPVEHFVGTAVGWGGLPEKYAFYIMGSLKENDGRPYEVTLKGGPCRCVLVHYRLRCRRTQQLPVSLEGMELCHPSVLTG